MRQQAGLGIVLQRHLQHRPRVGLDLQLEQVVLAELDVLALQVDPAGERAHRRGSTVVPFGPSATAFSSPSSNSNACGLSIAAAVRDSSCHGTATRQGEKDEAAGTEVGTFHGRPRLRNPTNEHFTLDERGREGSRYFAPPSPRLAIPPFQCQSLRLIHQAHRDYDRPGHDGQTCPNLAPPSDETNPPLLLARPRIRRRTRDRRRGALLPAVPRSPAAALAPPDA